MLPRFVIGICLLSLTVGLASAQTVYKCVDGGKTTYTSTPCGGAPSKELYYPVPTAEELRQGEARRQAAQQALNNSLEQKRASDEAYYRARSEAEANRAAYEASQPRVDPKSNERVMVHTSKGWDFKSRGQIEAERAARAGAPVTATGAAWESERTTSYGPSGWDTGTRLDAAKEEGERLRRRDEGTVIVNGVPYARSGRHGVIDPHTGKHCPISGRTVVCN